MYTRDVRYVLVKSKIFDPKPSDNKSFVTLKGIGKHRNLFLKEQIE